MKSLSRELPLHEGAVLFIAQVIEGVFTCIFWIYSQSSSLWFLNSLSLV